MSPQQLTTLLHAAIVALGIVAYTVLTATGHDGNAVLAASGAWGGAAAVDRAIDSTPTTRQQ